MDVCGSAFSGVFYLRLDTALSWQVRSYSLCPSLSLSLAIYLSLRLLQVKQSSFCRLVFAWCVCVNVFCVQHTNDSFDGSFTSP